MEHLKIDFINKKLIVGSLEYLANSIANDFVLKINNAIYQIVDFEFYVYSEGQFRDPFTNKNIQQLKSGTLYLHSSGVDITCGDEVNYGGILLRSIVKLNSANESLDGIVKQFEGPQIVVSELFSNLNPLNGELNEIALISRNDSSSIISTIPVQKLFSTSRVGLKRKVDDTDDYYFNFPLRYIAVLTRNTAFKQKIKGFERILLENIDGKTFTKENADTLIGYKIPI